MMAKDILTARTKQKFSLCGQGSFTRSTHIVEEKEYIFLGCVAVYPQKDAGFSHLQRSRVENGWKLHCLAVYLENSDNCSIMELFIQNLAGNESKTFDIDFAPLFTT